MSKITENGWDCLLTQIDEGNVALILGNELYFVRDNNGNLINLDEYLLQEMCLELDIPYDDEIDFCRLCDARTRLLWDELDSSPYYWTYKKLTQLKYENRIIAPNIERLLSIGKFRIVLTTAITDIAYDIMSKLYGDISINGLRYEVGSATPDISLQSSTPYFYQMFGNVSPIDYKFVLTEDDLLNFMHCWLDKDRHPENIASQLYDKYILAIGCNYPNWLFRFFFSSFKGNHPTKGRLGLVADSRLDGSLVRFLSRKKMDTHQDADKFIDELIQRWNTRSVSKTECREIFISYASEDYDKAALIASLFEANGKKVWFDKRSLTAGEDYDASIRSHIDNCDGFIPILSRNTLSGSNRYYEKEWTWAFESAQNSSISVETFIFPIMIECLEFNAIPHPFKYLHISDFSKPETNHEFELQKIWRRIYKRRIYETR